MTDDIQTRVQSAFAQVFPAVPESEIGHATQNSIDGWDSVTHVILFATLAEEFGFEVDYEAAAEVQSFADVVNYVRVRSMG